MNITRTVTLLWTPWSLFVSVLLVLITAGLCLYAWRRSGYRRGLGMLELLRFTLVSLAALMLNQPEFIEQFRPEEKPSVAVLWDASPSMETPDATSGTGSTASSISRREAISKLIEPSSWSGLGERVDVVIQPFSGGEDGRGTDLCQPLAKVPDKVNNLVGVVLVSDGDWNEGLPPVQAATSLRLKGVPVFAVPVGQPTRLPDVELLSLDAPTFAVAGKSVRVPFSIDSSPPRDFGPPGKTEHSSRPSMPSRSPTRSTSCRTRTHAASCCCMRAESMSMYAHRSAVAAVQ